MTRVDGFEAQGNRQMRLPDSRWAVEDHRRRTAFLDRTPKRGARSQNVLLTDELVERPRSHAVR